MEVGFYEGGDKMQYIDTDSKINWPEFYGRYLKNVKKAGIDKISALCPFHDDHHNSFWFNTKNGCYKCEACGESGNGQVFLQKIEDIDSKEAYKRILKEAGQYREMGKGRYTVDDYCNDKCLPVEFVLGLGVKDKGEGISIPYYDDSGKVAAERLRLGKRQFKWKRGSRLCLYGLWLLERCRKTGYVVLVEGESDSHTLWLHRIPALGVPGAGTFKSEWADCLKGLKVYIHKEPDMGGETFVRKICEALNEREFKGEVLKICIPDFKDPSDLHISGNFDREWNKVMADAEPVDINGAAAKRGITLPGAPVMLKAPEGWRISCEGIDILNNKTGLWDKVCRTPVLISRRMKSQDTGEEKVEIAFYRDGSWQTAIVQRSVLFQSRTITCLADLGITVTSENARLLVKYLGELESLNIEAFKVSKCVSQLGWYGKNFMPGMPGDLVVDVDRQMQKWVNAYSSEGTLEEWVENMRPYRDNYIFRFLLSCSFAAPLLRLLNHRVFLVHNWGESRSGKTAALKAALSVWGDPEELMGSFNATKVGLERLAGFFNDLPLGIDEKQVAGTRQDFIDSLVYMLSIGTTKVRGAKSGGLQDSRNWRCIVLTTGEEPLSSMSSQTGVYTRALEICGAPFDSEASAREMHNISSKVYGHAGCMFIKRLVSELEAQSEMLKNTYEEINKHLAKEYPDKLGSHISAAAVAAAADKLVSLWIFGDDGKSIEMGEFIMDNLEGRAETDITVRAYEFIRDWVMANNTQFTDDARAPRFGYCSDKAYYIFPHILQEAVTKYGYPYRKILKDLGDRELIGTSYDGGIKRHQVIKRFGNRVGRFIEFKFGEMEETPPF